MKQGRMRRLAGGVAALSGLLQAATALGAERQASLRGVLDRPLRTAIERAIPEAKSAPKSRVEARRRAETAGEDVIAVLRSEGYYDYEVTPDIGEGDRPQPFVTVVVGPRTLLAPARVDWAGPPPVAAVEVDADKALALPSGAPAKSADIVAAEGRVLAAVQQGGYADAKAVSRAVVVNHADHTATVTFRLNAGPLVRLGDLKITSKGHTREGFIRKLRPWRTGDVYDPRKVAELERRLLDTHVFDQASVALAPEPGPDGLRPVLVTLSDRTRNTLSAEAGYSSTEGGDIDLRLSQYDRFGAGDTLTYEIRYGAIDSRLGVEWSLPDFLKPGQTLTTDAAFIQSVTNAYRDTGPELKADLTRRFGQATYLTGGVSVDADEVEDYHEGTRDIVSLKLLGAFAYDRTDNPLDPHHGFKIEGRAEPTLITLDETLAYLKLQTQVSTYVPIGPDAATVLAFRLHVGTILGGTVPGVPAPDRFYAGGGGSVRGYAYQTVGPYYADDNVPVGGVSLAEGTVEIRRRLTQSLGGVLFFDTGNVSEQITPDFRRTLSSVGFGLRYNLGFAPLRADIAFPLEQANGASQQAFQVYLSIGQSF